MSGHDEDNEEPDDNANYFVKYCVDVIVLLLFLVFGILLPYFIFNDEHAGVQEYPGYYETLYFTSNETNGTYVSHVYIQDPPFTRTFRVDTAVSGTLLFVLDSVVPLSYVFLLSYFWLYKWLHWNGKYLYYEFISFFYAYLGAMSLTFWLTRFIKYYCSWQRPDFWDRCQPLFSFTNDAIYDSYMKFDSCDYESDPDLDESDYEKAFTSFVSGHASYMFTAAIVLTYWTYGKLNHPSLTKEQRLSLKFRSNHCIGQCIGTKWYPPKDMKHDNDKDEYKYVIDCSWIVGFLLATWGCWGSMFVAISRIDDHRHFPVDLVGGGLLALSNATFGFLTQYDYGKPFSKRVLRIMKNDEDIMLVKEKGKLKSNEIK